MEVSPSQYTRMILGTSSTPSPRCAPRERHKKRASHVSDSVNERRATQVARESTKRELSHSVIDRAGLESLITDSIVLAGTVSIMAFLFPRLVPWACLPIFIALVTLFGFSNGVYGRNGGPYAAGTIKKLAKATLFATGLIYIAELGFVACVGLFSSSLAALTISRIARQWARHSAWQRGRQESTARRVLIIGGGMLARNLAQSLRSDSLRHTIVCGFLDEELPLSPAVLGRIADLDWLARSLFVDEVILALPDQPAQARFAAEVAFRNHLDILAVPDLPPGPWPGSRIDRIGEIGVVTLHREPLPGLALTLKRLLDVVGSALGLLVISPLLATIALLIRLDSAGPAVYSAERTGAKGSRFKCHKFRSMVTNADHLKEELRARNQRSGPIFKINNDPRITRVGSFIRKYSLDELPQLWNVLKGEMSLVGPRPHPVDEVNHYELSHYRRLDVKPGITGLWQITARDCPSFDLNMHLDLTYIENWTVLLDLRILAKTIHVLFAPEGA